MEIQSFNTFQWKSARKHLVFLIICDVCQYVLVKYLAMKVGKKSI